MSRDTTAPNLGHRDYVQSPAGTRAFAERPQAADGCTFRGHRRRRRFVTTGRRFGRLVPRHVRTDAARICLPGRRRFSRRRSVTSASPARRAIFCCSSTATAYRRPGFVAGYRQAARPGELLFGRRVLVNRSLTATVEAAQLPIETWTLPRLLRCRLRGQINSVVKCFVDAGRLVRRKHRAWRRLRSCNFGVWRSDFEAVNGFDEAYQGWGYEDSDLTIRLLNHGLHLLPAPAASTVFHLWHHELPRESAGRNWQRLDTLRHSRRTRAKKIGLDRHPAAIRSSTDDPRKAG